MLLRQHPATVLANKKDKWIPVLRIFSLSAGPIGPNQKASFVTFSLLVNFVVLIRVAYGSRSHNRERILDPDPGKLYRSLQIRIHNTGGFPEAFFKFGT
jgi:hypothetical protein